MRPERQKDSCLLSVEKGQLVGLVSNCSELVSFEEGDGLHSQNTVKRRQTQLRAEESTAHHGIFIISQHTSAVPHQHMYCKGNLTFIPCCSREDLIWNSSYSMIKKHRVYAA